jgi:hypothetical protein
MAILRLPPTASTTLPPILTRAESPCNQPRGDHHMTIRPNGQSGTGLAGRKNLARGPSHCDSPQRGMGYQPGASAAVTTAQRCPRHRTRPKRAPTGAQENDIAEFPVPRWGKVRKGAIHSVRFILQPDQGRNGSGFRGRTSAAWKSLRQKNEGRGMKGRD